MFRDTYHTNARQSFLTRDSIANLFRLGSLIAIAVGLFAIVTACAAVYLNLSAQLELERSDRAASQQADRIADELSDIHTSLRDASVVDAARTGSVDKLRTALRKRDVVNILDLRLLPADVNEIAVGEDIDLSLAETDVAIEAVRNERADIRVFQPGAPAESLVFAQRMPGDTGVLLLHLTVSVVVSLLRDDEMLDFVGLAQQGNPGSTLLGARGGSATERTRDIPIAGSSLVLQWNREVVQAPVDNRAAFIVGCSGVIVMMIGLLLRRRTRLAQYLGEPDTVAPDRSRSRRPPAAKPAARQGGTVVMAPDKAKTKAAAEQLVDEDEPPTMVARSPDLPEWLRDDFDNSPDELTATSPMSPPSVPDPDDYEDDELLEDFKAYQGVDPSLFKADGIYGEVGSDLNLTDMVVMGQAIASEAVERGLRRICIAHDGRPSGPKLLGGLAQGLSVSGVDVVELGAVPAPVAWFAASRRQQAGGVMVTGGDKPEAINGLEIVFDGLWLGREDRRTLLDRIRNEEFATRAGERSDEDEAAAYLERITANHRLERPLTVVVDWGNAVNATVAIKLLEALDAEAIPLNADNETDPAEMAGFDSSERLQVMKLCIDNYDAHLGLVFDRTGGRLRMVGPDGRAVEPARLAAILIAGFYEQGEGQTLLIDEALTGQLDEITGIEVLPFSGNAGQMQRKMRALGAAMAIHADGSVCVANEWHGLPDAFHAAALLLKRVAAEENPSAEILAATGQKTNSA